ncbi:hypothetical protein SAY86_022124 [Trapa natans]|uniref:Uncharacterized protein n=1 Tax=Trapa natans TaxID=22666 RepID=A0AAN7MLS8_TRANT|nr:hypothetical protein SAY86_022124 [Trapa natans]
MANLHAEASLRFRDHRHDALGELSVLAGQNLSPRDVAHLSCVIRSNHYLYLSFVPGTTEVLADTWPARTAWSIDNLLLNYGEKDLRISQRIQKIQMFLKMSKIVILSWRSNPVIQKFLWNGKCFFRNLSNKKMGVSSCLTKWTSLEVIPSSSNRLLHSYNLSGQEVQRTLLPRHNKCKPRKKRHVNILDWSILLRIVPSLITNHFIMRGNAVAGAIAFFMTRIFLELKQAKSWEEVELVVWGNSTHNHFNKLAN